MGFNMQPSRVDTLIVSIWLAASVTRVNDRGGEMDG